MVAVNKYYKDKANDRGKEMHTVMAKDCKKVNNW